jgi:hypothetical protein
VRRYKILLCSWAWEVKPSPETDAKDQRQYPQNKFRPVGVAVVAKKALQEYTNSPRREVFDHFFAMEVTWR